MMSAEFRDLYEYCVKLFGEDRVEEEQFKSPNSIEIAIELPRNNSKAPKQASLGIYESNPPQYFMHIDDFDFEYDDNKEHAINEMRRYLNAAAEGRLSVKTRTIFGRKLNYKLVINNIK